MNPRERLHFIEILQQLFAEVPPLLCQLTIPLLVASSRRKKETPSAPPTENLNPYARTWRWYSPTKRLHREVFHGKCARLENKVIEGNVVILTHFAIHLFDGPQYFPDVDFGTKVVVRNISSTGRALQLASVSFRRRSPTSCRPSRRRWRK